MNLISNNYYTLIAGLPEISLEDTKLFYSFARFKEDLKDILHTADYQLIEVLCLKFDNQNLLNILQDKQLPFNTQGNYSKEYLESEIKNPETILPYFAKFITAYKEKTPLIKGISWENQLYSLYYEYASGVNNEFLRKWFQFESELRNITSALKCRAYGIDIQAQIIANSEAAQMLLTKATKDFGLGKDVDYIEKLITTLESSDLLMQEKAIDHLKWEWLENASFFHYFTIEKVLTFALKTEMVERWLKLDDTTGKAIFSSIRENLEKGYELPEIFKVRTLKH